MVGQRAMGELQPRQQGRVADDKAEGGLADLQATQPQTPQLTQVGTVTRAWAMGQNGRRRLEGLNELKYTGSVCHVSK